MKNNGGISLPCLKMVGIINKTLARAAETRGKMSVTAHHTKQTRNNSDENLSNNDDHISKIMSGDGGFFSLKINIKIRYPTSTQCKIQT